MTFTIHSTHVHWKGWKTLGNVGGKISSQKNWIDAAVEYPGHLTFYATNEGVRSFRHYLCESEVLRRKIKAKENEWMIYFEGSWVTREEERFSLAEDWLSSGEKRKMISWWPNVVVINMLNIANAVQCCSLIPPIISFYFARKIGNRCRDWLKPAKIHRNAAYKAKHSICTVFGLTTLIPQHSLSSLGKPSEI